MKPGQVIKAQRQKIGMTQLQLANKLGYTIPQFISLMENGHSKIPLTICGKLKRALEMKQVDCEKFKKALVEEYSKKVVKEFNK